MIHTTVLNNLVVLHGSKNFLFNLIFTDIQIYSCAADLKNNNTYIHINPSGNNKRSFYSKSYYIHDEIRGKIIPEHSNIFG
jgi:hypothetical protein